MRFKHNQYCLKHGSDRISEHNRPASSNRIVDKWKFLSERYVNPSESISHTVPLASPDVGGFDEYCEYVNDVRLLKTTCSAVYIQQPLRSRRHACCNKKTFHFVSNCTWKIRKWNTMWRVANKGKFAQQSMSSQNKSQSVASRHALTIVIL